MNWAKLDAESIEGSAGGGNFGMVSTFSSKEIALVEDMITIGISFSSFLFGEIF